jgi:uncharacterized protein
MSENAVAEQLEMPKHGEFCWNELSGNNLEECKKFYSEIFGWDFQKSEAAGMEYFEIGLKGGKRFGGMWQITEECKRHESGEEIVPGWMNYVAVDDVDGSASKAFDLGGTIVSPPTDIPNVGRFCIIKDPTGAVISLITLKH